MQGREPPGQPRMQGRESPACPGCRAESPEPAPDVGPGPRGIPGCRAEMPDPDPDAGPRAPVQLRMQGLEPRTSPGCWAEPPSQEPRTSPDAGPSHRAESPEHPDVKHAITIRDAKLYNFWISIKLFPEYFAFDADHGIVRSVSVSDSWPWPTRTPRMSL
jgi:hypothetical protein